MAGTLSSSQKYSSSAHLQNLGATTVDSASSPSHSNHSPSHSPEGGVARSQSRHSSPTTNGGTGGDTAALVGMVGNQQSKEAGFPSSSQQQLQQGQGQQTGKSTTTNPLSSVSGSGQASLQNSFGFPMVGGASTNNLDVITGILGGAPPGSNNNNNVPPSPSSANNNTVHVQSQNPSNQAQFPAQQQQQQQDTNNSNNSSNLPQPPSSSIISSVSDSTSSPTVAAQKPNSSSNQTQQQQSGNTISVTHANSNQRHKSLSPTNNSVEQQNLINQLVSPSGENIDEWAGSDGQQTTTARKSRANSHIMAKNNNSTTETSTAATSQQNQQTQQQQQEAALLKEQLEKERQEALDKIIKLQKLTRKFLARKKTCLAGRYVSAQALTSSLIAAATSMDRISRHEFGWAPFA